MNLFVALCWTIICIVDIVKFVNGDAPNWVQVFYPVAAALAFAWEEVFLPRKRS